MPIQSTALTVRTLTVRTLDDLHLVGTRRKSSLSEALARMVALGIAG